MVLDGVIVALWHTWTGPADWLLVGFQVLPLALLIALLLPALAFVGGSIAWEMVRDLIGYALTRFKGRRHG